VFSESGLTLTPIPDIILKVFRFRFPLQSEVRPVPMARKIYSCHEAMKSPAVNGAGNLGKRLDKIIS
ncbi:MAG: hypothetical protein VB023_08470, partial [Oscillibacter sp.]|nr:hypothetical protein [Oscillibacter sp.]